MNRRRIRGTGAAHIAALLVGLLCFLPCSSLAEERSGLSWLAVENGVFSPVFSSDRNTYYAILENGIDSFDAAGVQMRACNADAEISVVCLDALEEGERLPQGRRVTFLITVEESDRNVSRYYLKLYRKAAYTAPIQEEYQLANITINGGAIQVPAFSSIKAYYEIEVPADVTELDVQAYPVDRSKTAVVIGVPKIMPDEPVCVSIVVQPSGGGETFSVYTLVLRREGFMTSRSYTPFQLLAAVLAAFFAGAALTAYLGAMRRRNAP